MGNPPEYVEIARLCFRIAAVLFDPMRFVWVRHCDLMAISAGIACDLRWPDSRESIRRFAWIAWFSRTSQGDSRERLRVPELHPLVCESRFGALENRESQVWGGSRESLRRYENGGLPANRFAGINSHDSPRFALRFAGPWKLATSHVWLRSRGSLNWGGDVSGTQGWAPPPPAQKKSWSASGVNLTKNATSRSALSKEFGNV